MSPSLTANFGNIAGGDTAVATWLMQSSLQGNFSEYEATFEHVNSLGMTELSLIKETTIHELIHIVDTSIIDGDNISDFLVNDINDLYSIPDMVYYSNGDKAEVHAVTNTTIEGMAGYDDLDVDLTAEMSTGWNYRPDS